MKKLIHIASIALLAFPSAMAQEAPTPVATGSPSPIALAGTEGIAASGARNWIVVEEEAPLYKGANLHPAQIESLKNQLHLQLLRASLQQPKGMKETIWSIIPTQDNLTQGMLPIDLPSGKLLAWVTSSGACIASGEVFKHANLKSELILIGFEKKTNADKSKAVHWLEAPLQERSTFLIELRLRLDRQVPAPPQAEPGLSVEEAATDIVYQYHRLLVSQTKLHPKALYEDLKEILDDPSGTLFGRNSKLSRNFRRIKQDLKDVWDNTLTGRGSSVDVLLHGAEEGLEKLWNEKLTGRGSVVDRQIHKAEQTLEKVARELPKLKEPPRKVVREIKRAWNKIF